MPALSVLDYASYRSQPPGLKVIDLDGDFDYSFGFPRRKLRGTINRARSYFSVPDERSYERDRQACAIFVTGLRARCGGRFLEPFDRTFIWKYRIASL